MTLSDILESNNIRSDRYAMAAISHICKAFGYKTYSKESWPWGKDMQFEWQCSKGINTDVLEAELLLEKARTTALEESNKDNNIYNIISEDSSLISLHNQIKNLNNRLSNLKDNLSNSNNTSSNISNISINTISKIDDISQIKSEQDAPIALGITTTYPETAIAVASGGGGHGTLMWTNGNSLNNVGSKTTKAYWTGNFNYYQSPYSNEIILTVNKGEQAAPIAVGSITTYPTVALASIEDDRGHGTLLWTNGDKLENTTGTISTQAYWAGDSNYKESPKSNTISLTVIKFTPSITLSVNNRLYNGSPLYATAFIEAPEGGKQIKGTIYYGTSEGASTYNVTYNVTHVNLSSVSITDVDTQTVYAYFIPDYTCNDVYNTSSSVNKTFNISKASQNPPIATGDTATYPTVALASAMGGGGQGTLIWTNGATLDTTGTKKTKAYWSGNSNYNASVYSNEVTLTVNKFTPVITLSVTNRAYNGSPLYATAFIEVPEGGKQIKGTIYYGTSEGASTYNVTYNGTHVNLSSVSITDVGAQTVYAYFVPDSTCNDVYNNSESVNKTYVISKADQEPPVATGDTTTYPAIASASASSGGGQGTLIWTNGATLDTAGTKKTKAYWSGNSNYNESPLSNEVCITVWKATPTVTLSVTDRTYNDSPLYATAIASVNGVIFYGDSEGATTYNIGYNGAPVDLINISITDTGQQTVWAYLVPTDSLNYNNSDNISKTFNINKANLSASVSMTGWTYGGTASNPSVSGNSENGNVTYTYKISTADDSTYTNVKPSNAGTYTVRAQIAETTNYNATTVTNTFTISKADLITSVSMSNWTYADTAPEPSVTGNSGNGSVTYTYKVSTAADSTYTSTKPSNAGIYTVRAVIDATSNYNGATVINTFTINKVTPTVVSPVPNVLTYNKSSQELATIGSTNFGVLKYSLDKSNWSTNMLTAINGNSYRLYYKVDGDNNINDVPINSILCSIAEQRVTTPTIILSQNSYTYNGSQCKPTPTVKDDEGDIIDPIEYNVSYLNNINAGTATVIISDIVNGNYYIEGTQTFTIAQDNLSVSVSMTGWTYGETSSNPSVSGNIGNGNITYTYKVSTADDSTYTSTKPSNAGTYTVRAQIAETTNYSATTVTNTFTIAKANISPAVSMLDWTYGETASNPSVSGNSGNGNITYTYKVSTADDSTYTSTKPSNAGTYTVRAVIDATSNYNGATVTNTFTIAKAPGSVTTVPTAKSGLIYNDSAQALINAGSGTGTMYYSLSPNSGFNTSIPTATNARDYTVYYYTAASTNYNQSAIGSISAKIVENYFRLTTLENGTTFTFTNAINYSLDYGTTWASLAANTNTPSLNANTDVLFKGILTPTSSDGIGTFSSNSKTFNVSGNAMSLLYGDDFKNRTLFLGYDAFKNLLKNSKVVNASNLVLPATRLVSGCYYSMFFDCTSLTTAPELPATTLSEYCYGNMFSGCTSLTTAPELPATSLEDGCYDGMFFGCTSLTTAPELSATTLALYCYTNMFNGCTSLTTAPELPATTLADYCYYHMFQGCTSLTTAPELPATTLAKYCYRCMFYGCSSLITTPELPATTLAENCYDSMFQDCTSLTTAPVLSATTLATACYKQMFHGCTSLTTAPELPATTLVISCYNYMFFGCTSLTSAPALPATTLANDCYEGMFIRCTSLTSAPELPATMLASGCYSSMFSRCTSLTTAPELLVTTLASGCYNFMFFGCTSLTTAPVLPATTLAGGCYSHMFSGCTSLTSAPALPATTLAKSCYGSMFSGCTSLTTAPELPATSLEEGCYNNMFFGCTSLTTAPVLPATTLVSNCYSYMFIGCSSLNYIKALFTTTPDTTYTDNWVNGVASSGTFIKNAAATWNNVGYNGVPINWSTDTQEFTQEFTLTALENGTTFKFTNAINYSLDYGATWTSLAANTNTPSLNANTDILFKGTLTPTSSSGIGKFSSNSKTFNASCNIMSLLYGDNFKNQTSLEGKDYAFYNLFYNSKVVNASNLVLPATTLATYCYSGMFYGCSSLITTPELPATRLVSGCYKQMFNECTSLTTAPELPATTLADYCYGSMFSGCTSLITAPELPATTLTGTYCYSGMFQECTSLASAPELPATTLDDYCYYYMFSGCTILITAPELPATTLADRCYDGMFSRCTSLTTAPELPATTLTDWCYDGMFSRCTSLTTAPELPATTLAEYCYGSMFSRCTSLTTAPVLPAITLVSNCYGGMFSGCTSLTTAPELPATTLAEYCYGSMFSGCTSLTTAPVLPATTLVSNCYSYMFNNCSSLNYIKALFTTTPDTSYTNNWVYGVAASGTFIKNAAATWNITGVNGVPENWSTDTQEFTLTALENGTTFKFTNSINYSLDYGATWTSLAVNTNTPSLNTNTDILFKGTLTPTSSSGIGTFSSNSKTFNASGNVMSLLYGDNYINQTSLSGKNYAFSGLFAGSNIINANNLILSATILAENCYSSMFYNCTSLTTAPSVLPATILAKKCYNNMFTSCRSLMTTPELCANTLAEKCCYNMFYGCSSLTTTPILSATTLEESCYDGMFYGCSSLTTISKASGASYELPATTLAKNCYWAMFQGCRSLQTAPKLPALTLANGCYAYMFAECKSLTTAPELPATTLASDCYNAMFWICTNLQTPPELSATTLTNGCYQYMFARCTSLTTAPLLPATTLVSNCYSYMFNGCTSLNYIKALFTTMPGTSYTNNWVNGVAASGTFVKSPDGQNVDGVHGMPTGWTIIKEYVEIGGIKWATLNVGATSVTDAGLYFQWGDTQGYTASQVNSGQKYFGWSDYKYGNNTSSPGAAGMTKYNASDGKTALDVSDDAARANLGGQWRMPTTAEWQALSATVDVVRTTDYRGTGVTGLVCTNKTDGVEVLFLPASGYCDNASVYDVNDRGFYWSSSINSSNVQNAYSLGFYDGGEQWHTNHSRCHGFPVRGVFD